VSVYSHWLDTRGAFILYKEHGMSTLFFVCVYFILLFIIFTLLVLHNDGEKKELDKVDVLSSHDEMMLNRCDQF